MAVSEFWQTLLEGSSMFDVLRRVSHDTMSQAVKEHAERLAQKPAAPKMTAVPGSTVPKKIVMQKGEKELRDEHTALCTKLGLAVPEANKFEAFTNFMAENDLPLFSLTEVCLYMDAKAAKEGQGFGWYWVPLRTKDQLPNYMWGNSIDTGGVRQPLSFRRNADTGVVSDFYGGAFLGGQEVYKHTVPVHALRKVALIEDKFKASQVAFMVSDYATAEQFRPDPFLMAVIQNADLAKGTGRFVIDFWDEPGFGLAQMLAK